MAEIPERDAALLLDMLFAARDALEFADGLTKERFLSSRLHQNAITASLPRSRGGVCGRRSSAACRRRRSALETLERPPLLPRWSVGASRLIERLTPLIPAEDDDCT
jgi:hypothetical protein